MRRLNKWLIIYTPWVAGAALSLALGYPDLAIVLPIAGIPIAATVVWINKLTESDD